MQSGLLTQNQFPRRCHRFTVMKDDLYGAGLGFTAKLMLFVLVESTKENRVLLEGPSSRWCTRDSKNLQCYYKPWSNCSLSRNSDVKFLSLKAFHKSRRWYGMSLSTLNIQAEGFSILFTPLQHVEEHAQRVIAKCGGSDYWTVHVRISPEKQKEQRKLPSVERYLSVIPQNASRILWQTSNPVVFARLVNYSKLHKQVQTCATEFSRYINDVWGGRYVTKVDESGLTGAVNGALGRRGIGVISLKSSMWTWFLTIGTSMKLFLV